MTEEINCSNSYELINGIKCYSPGEAFSGNNFPPDAFETLFRLENSNFWFVSRNRIIKFLFKKYVKSDNGSKKKVLEVGCGTGFVLQSLAEDQNLILTGSELLISGLQYAQKRVPRAEFIQFNATKIPFKNEFDVLGAFDVIEHIDDDILVLKNMMHALRPDGILFMTVPQHKFLWSTTDEIVHHKRRYGRDELLKKLSDTGFEVKFIGSFVFLLMPLMALSRFLKRRQPAGLKTIEQELDELKLNPILNRVLSFAMRFDEQLIKIGISLPYGGSLIVVAKKQRAC